VGPASGAAKLELSDALHPSGIECRSASGHGGSFGQHRRWGHAGLSSREPSRHGRSCCQSAGSSNGPTGGAVGARVRPTPSNSSYRRCTQDMQCWDSPQRLPQSGADTSLLPTESRPTERAAGYWCDAWPTPTPARSIRGNAPCMPEGGAAGRLRSTIPLKEKKKNATDGKETWHQDDVNYRLIDPAQP